MSVMFACVLAMFISSAFYLLLDAASFKGRFENRKIHARVEALFSSSASIERQNNFSSIFRLNKALRRQPLLKKLLNLLSLTGWNMPISFFILSDFLWGGIVFLLVSLITKNQGIALLSACFMMMVPYWFLIINKQRYIRKFTQAFPDALVLIKSALRAGQGIQASFQMVAQEGPYPVSREFAQVVREIELGSHLADALSELNRRIDTVDLRIFILGIFIQSEIGGNLVELIHHVENTIRERLTMQRELRALSAQGRMTGLVLMALPIGFAMILLAINPQYFDPMIQNEQGRKVIMVAVFMQFVGGLIIRKITNFKVV